MLIQHATRLMREVCALRHLSVNTDRSYPTRLIVHLLYACGLRVSEPLNLRIKDVDLRAGRLYVYQAKGNKGRVVLFPKCLTEPIERQIVSAKVMAAQDHARGIPVALPGLLANGFGVAPPGGFRAAPPKGGTPNRVFKQALRTRFRAVLGGQILTLA
jgi:integrase